MKTLLILFLALTTVFASAMSIRRPFRKPVAHSVDLSFFFERATPICLHRTIPNSIESKQENR